MVLYSNASILQERLEKFRALYKTCDLNKEEDVKKVVQELAGVMELVEPSTPENQKVLDLENLEK